MNNHRLISYISAAVVIISILFMPFVGCGGMNMSGLDVLQDNQVGTDIKFFVVMALLCAALIYVLKAQLQIVITSLAGAVSLIVAYLIAHNQNGGIELKAGAFLALIGYAVTAVVNYVEISVNNQNVKTQNIETPKTENE
jgi:uncharacterized membrane protein (UPF0136 family)